MATTNTEMWHWIELMLVKRDEDNNTTEVTIDWASKPTSDGDKPTSDVPGVEEVERTTENEYIWWGAGLAEPAESEPIFEWELTSDGRERVKVGEDVKEWKPKGKNFVWSERIHNEFWLYPGKLPRDKRTGGLKKFTLPSSTGRVYPERADVYNSSQWEEEWLQENFDMSTFGTGTEPEIRNISIPDVEANKQRKFEFDVVNTGGKGSITISVDGRNAESFSTKETFSNEESKTYSGTYEIGFSESQSVISITAKGKDSNDEKTASAQRILPDIEISNISFPERLCVGDSRNISFTVSNKGGNGKVKTELNGASVENLSNTSVVGGGQEVTYKSSMTMPRKPKTTATITVEAHKENLSKTVGVSRLLPKPSLAVNAPEYVRPGDSFTISARGEVENCNINSTIEIKGFTQKSSDGQVSPGSAITESISENMPGKSIAFSAKFDANRTITKEPYNVRPHEAALIDSSNGVGIHAPKDDSLKYELLFVGKGITGQGENVGSENINISKFPNSRAARLLSSNPMAEVRYVEDTVPKLKEHTVTADKIFYIGGLSESDIAVALDGSFQRISDNWLLVNGLIMGTTFRILEPKETTIG